MEELIRKIRSDLRLAMNGVVSTSMREKGMDYKMNFGVDILSLRKMSSRYPARAELAEKLWETDTRELKILAPMLYPVEEFSPETADKWIAEIPNQEIREQLCMNLLQKVSFADELVQKWILSDDESSRTNGFWLFSRLVISRSSQLSKIDTVSVAEKAISDVNHPSVFVHQAAINALKFAGRTNSETARFILDKLSSFKASEIPSEKEIYDSLSFEFELSV